MSIRVMVATAALVSSGAIGPAAAQTEYGIKGGVSFGNISNKGLLPGSLKTRTGLAGGFYLGARSSIVGVGIEALYAQRGARSDQSISIAETKLDYVDVPAYLKILIPTPGIRPFAFAGPQVSFEVRCHRADDADCVDDPDRKKTNYAGVIGGGVRLGGGHVAVNLEARYVYGLTDLKLSTITSSESYKHRTFMLLVAIGK